MSSTLASYAALVTKDPIQGQSATIRASNPKLIQAFEYYDVKENSFHFQTNLIETQFCEDANRSTLFLYFIR